MLQVLMYILVEIVYFFHHVNKVKFPIVCNVFFPKRLDVDSAFEVARAEVYYIHSANERRRNDVTSERRANESAAFPPPSTPSCLR